MQRLFILLALPVAMALTACEMRDKDRDGDLDVARTDTTEAPSTTAPTMPATPAQPGRGEGERELALDPDTDQPMTNEQLMARFQTDLANDADIKKVTSNVRLELDNGDLVLRGTVPNHDVGDAIEDYAQKLAGRMVNNELEIDRQVGELAPKADKIEPMPMP